MGPNREAALRCEALAWVSPKHTCNLGKPGRSGSRTTVREHTAAMPPSSSANGLLLVVSRPCKRAPPLPNKRPYMLLLLIRPCSTGSARGLCNCQQGRAPNSHSGTATIMGPRRIERAKSRSKARAPPTSLKPPKASRRAPLPCRSPLDAVSELCAHPIQGISMISLARLMRARPGHMATNADSEDVASPDAQSRNAPMKQASPTMQVGKAHTALLSGAQPATARSLSLARPMPSPIEAHSYPSNPLHGCAPDPRGSWLAEDVSGPRASHEHLHTCPAKAIAIAMQPTEPLKPSLAQILLEEGPQVATRRPPCRQRSGGLCPWSVPAPLWDM